MASDPSALLQMLAQNSGLQGQAIQNNVNQNTDQQLGQAQAAQDIQKGQMQIAAAQQAQAQAAQKAQALKTYLADPTPAALGAYARAYPEDADAAVKAYNAMDDVQKTSRLTTFGQLYSSADNNRPDLVAHQLNQLRTAELAQNPQTDTSEVDDALAQLQSGNPDKIKNGLNAVKGIAQIHIAASDPSKFAQTYSDFGGSDDANAPDAKHFTNTPQGDIYDQRTGQVVRGAGGSTPAGVAPTTLPDIADRIGAIEGTAQNPASSAAGYGQFTNGTWLSTYKSQNPNSGLTDAQILAKRSDPAIAKQMLGALTGSNAQTLQAAGVQPNAANLYLAHFLGPGGALSVLHADPSTPVSQILPASFIKANPSVLGGQTAGQVQAWANTKMTQGAPNSGASADPGILSDGAIGDMISQYKAGDKTVLQGLGRGKQGAQNIVKFRNMLHDDLVSSGTTGADLAAQMAEYQGDVAAQRTAGTRMAQVDLASNEFTRLAPIALRTSGIVARSGWLPIAKVQLAIANGSNDPKYRAFNAANNALVNTYARAVSPTGQPTVDGQNHARQLLDTAFDDKSYRGVVAQMSQEIEAAKAAPHDVRASLRSAVTGKPDPTIAPPSAPQQAAAEIPQGAVHIGTYKGAPVYQLPNGKKWTP